MARRSFTAKLPRNATYEEISELAGFYLAEERPHALEDQKERDADDRHDGQHRECQRHVDRQQQHAGANDEEHRRDERRDGLRHEQLHRVHVGGEVGQEGAGRDVLDEGVVVVVELSVAPDLVVDRLLLVLDCFEDEFEEEE